MAFDRDLPDAIAGIAGDRDAIGRGVGHGIDAEGERMVRAELVLGGGESAIVPVGKLALVRVVGRGDRILAIEPRVHPGTVGLPLVEHFGQVVTENPEVVWLVDPSAEFVASVKEISVRIPVGEV